MPFKHYATRVYDDQRDENIACAKEHGYDFDSLRHPAITNDRLLDGEYLMVASWNESEDPRATKPFHMMFITLDEFVRHDNAFKHEDRLGHLTRMTK